MPWVREARRRARQATHWEVRGVSSSEKNTCLNFRALPGIQKEKDMPLGQRIKTFSEQGVSHVGDIFKKYMIFLIM